MTGSAAALPHRSGNGWDRAVRAALESWGSGSMNAAPAGGDPAAGVARVLASVEDERRAVVLAALRRRLGSLPFHRIHPSWIARCVPDEPLLACWALASLPEPIRRRVVLRLPAAPDLVSQQAGGAASTGPPPWFREWWRREMAHEIAYPHPLPGAISATEPLSFLFLLDAEPLHRVLRRFGLRALAMALDGLPRERVAALVFGLPADLRDLLVARRAAAAAGGERPGSGAERAPTPWSRALEELARSAKGDRLAVALALWDLAAQAPALGRRDDMTRLAYRLPANDGERLRRRLEVPPDGLAATDPQAWNQDLKTVVGKLVAQRALTVPDPAAESWTWHD